MASSNPPVKNVGFTIRVSLQDMANPGSFKANPTIAAGDFKVDIDGGGFNNPATLPSVSPAGGTAVLITLSASEMNGDLIFVTCIDQTNPKEWADYNFCIQTVTGEWLRPTTAGRTLDVSAGGEAGIDWANIGSPTTAQNLSGTNIDVDQVVASVSGAVGSVTGAVGSVTGNVGGNVNGNVVGSVGSVTGTVTANTTLIEGVDATDQIRDSILNDGTRFAGADIGSILTIVAAIQGYVDTEIAAIKAKTDQLTFTIANKVDSSIQSAGDFAQAAADKVWLTAVRTLTAFGFSVTVGTNNDKTGYTTTAADQQASADELLNRNIAGGGSGGARIVRDVIRLLRNRRRITAGVLTVYQEDDATPAFTANVTTAASNPITEIDPT